MDATVLGALIGIGASAIGGITTGWFTLRANRENLHAQSLEQKAQREHVFRCEQLALVYGPILAQLEELNECWQLYTDTEKNVTDYIATHQGKKSISDDILTTPMDGALDYKEYLCKQEIAVLENIKKTMIQNFGLCEVTTRKYYRVVVRFIENRKIIEVSRCKLDLSFTGEISNTSTIREDLESFKTDVEKILLRLRMEIEKAKLKTIDLPPKQQQLLQTTNDTNTGT